MSSDIVIKAKRMLLDLSGMIMCPIRNGAVEFQGHKYQLSFNVRRDAYEKLVAMTSQYLSIARLIGPCDYLFGIPIYVVCESDAPLVEIVIKPQEEGADA